jgi:anti-sigma regulatory factor (Ser/Thr protein kinase)
MGLRRAMPAVPSSVTVLRHDIEQFAAAAGIDDPQLSGIKLAVSEAVTNAVMHAYVGAERVGEVRLRARLADRDLHVTVSDDGSGMVPRLDSPGLGVGLPFIAHIADSLDIEHSASGGTRLRMTVLGAVAVGPA